MENIFLKDFAKEIIDKNFFGLLEYRLIYSFLKKPELSQYIIRNKKRFFVSKKDAQKLKKILIPMVSSFLKKNPYKAGKIRTSFKIDLEKIVPLKWFDNCKWDEILYFIKSNILLESYLHQGKIGYFVLYNQSLDFRKALIKHFGALSDPILSKIYKNSIDRENFFRIMEEPYQDDSSLDAKICSDLVSMNEVNGLVNSRKNKLTYGRSISSLILLSEYEEKIKEKIELVNFKERYYIKRKYFDGFKKFISRED